MGLFKALKDDLKSKLGVAKENVQASDEYQKAKIMVKPIVGASSITAEVAKEAGKQGLNAVREVKSGLLKSLSKELANSMPALSKAMRQSARETDEARRKSESNS